jgi:hypothetical protein
MMTDGEKGLAFYNSIITHPVVSPGTARPSYISSEQFSTAALHLMNLTGDIPAAIANAQTASAKLQTAVQALAPSPFKNVATSLLREGETDFKGFEARLQHWFDQSMDRVSGIYKRCSQYISLGLGALLAFGLQVDAIGIANKLWNEPSLRDAALANAAKTIGNEQIATKLLADSATHYDLTPLWVHWTASDQHLGVAAWIAGCLVTTIAVSLGAPFWFDTLQSFVSLRGTGPQPASTTSNDGGSSNSAPAKT